MMCDTKNHGRRHVLVQDLRSRLKSRLKSIESELKPLHQRRFPKWFPKWSFERENKKAIRSFLKQEKELCKSHITELENLALDDPKMKAALYRAHWFETLDKKLINGKSYVVYQIVKRKGPVFYGKCPLYTFFETAISQLSPDNYPTKERDVHGLSQILSDGMMMFANRPELFHPIQNVAKIIELDKKSCEYLWSIMSKIRKKEQKDE